MTEQQSLILIVDDNLTNIKVLFEVLATAGFRTFVATSGEDALDRLEMLEPSLILLDVMMSGMNGFETCSRIKANPKTQEIPVIFMTALSDIEHKVKGLSAGAVDYITKPFQQEEVLARVKIHLELYQLRRSLEQRVAERTADLSIALEQLQQAQGALQSSQLQLIQSEKMSALGNLVAGVAHEINNPVGFISGNIDYTFNSIQDLLELIELYQQRKADAEIAAKIEAIDLEYLRQDLPTLARSMKEGTDRISAISTSLRTFSRAETLHKQTFDLHESIDSTLLILRHRLKANQDRPDIEVIKNYDLLPQIYCHPEQLNQVFMNLFANAIDALEEANQGRSYDEIEAIPNQIIVTTQYNSAQESVTVWIKDNGIGMAEAVRQRIFDHLFTTKPVGKGTGLGMAIVQQIVVEKHAGTIEVRSEPGQGTEFVIRLPIKEAP